MMFSNGASIQIFKLSPEELTELSEVCPKVFMGLTLVLGFKHDI